ETVALKIIDSETPASDGHDSATTRANPWDQLDLAPELSVPTDAIQRLQPQVQKTVARTNPEIAPPSAQPLVPRKAKGDTKSEITAALPNRSLDDTPAERTQNSGVAASEIEFRRKQRTEVGEVKAPDLAAPQSVARMDTMKDQLLNQDTRRIAPKPLAEKAETRQDLLENLATIDPKPTDEKIANALTRDLDGSEKTSRDLEWGNPEKNTGPFMMASAPKRITDGGDVPEIYSGRTAEKRKEAASEFGGSQETERAVEQALNWLANHQEEDGRWSGLRYGGGQERFVLGHDRQGAGTASDTGLTGLSILAFLAAGHTHLEGDYRETVQRGLQYLLRSQSTNGEMAGDAKLFARMYCHAMATLAITEALAMTRDDRLKNAVTLAVNYSLKSQHASHGGWRYRPGDEGDMSQFVWQVLVMKSAELAGIEIPIRSKALMSVFLERCTSGDNDGLASYRPGLAPSAPMTAEALVCRYFLAENVPVSTAAEASQLLLREMPGSSQENLYYWYYGSLAMFQTGGTAWENWNHQLTKTLVGSQVTEGEFIGSWNPTGVWAGYGGRVYSTAMATLSLEVYYRYQTK
ncbi:MAG: terpene cyclase/mutase family protein, partial [Pirellulaceae bacterium]|nr:terpene cyclase/mutase family protein [Pirellulaceae bacterium]